MNLRKTGLLAQGTVWGRNASLLLLMWLSFRSQTLALKVPLGSDDGLVTVAARVLPWNFGAQSSVSSDLPGEQGGGDGVPSPGSLRHVRAAGLSRGPPDPPDAGAGSRGPRGQWGEAWERAFQRAGTRNRLSGPDTSPGNINSEDVKDGVR